MARRANFIGAGLSLLPFHLFGQAFKCFPRMMGHVGIFRVRQAVEVGPQQGDAFGCDGLDGVEARFTHTNTTRGSFTDIFCDVTVVALCVAGVAWKGLIYPVLAVLFIYSYTALAIFLVLHRMLRVSSVGILRPSRMVFFAVIALYLFFHIDLLNVLLLLYLLALPLLLLSFWRLRKAL